MMPRRGALIAMTALAALSSPAFVQKQYEMPKPEPEYSGRRAEKDAEAKRKAEAKRNRKLAKRAASEIARSEIGKMKGEK